MKFIIGIITFDRLDNLKRLLTGEKFIASVLIAGAQVCVFDQGSTDGTARWLADFAREKQYPLTVWRSDQYLNLVATRLRLLDRLVGQGIDRDDVIVHLDDDAWISDSAWLARWGSVFSSAANVGVIGQEACYISQAWDGLESAYQLKDMRECDVVSGSATAFRGGVFAAGCEYDMSYQPIWHEDADICLQALARGYSVMGIPRTWGVEHDSHHKTPDVLYYRNFEFLRSRWKGKGLTVAERLEKAMANGVNHHAAG
jgi:glycosyltransferase involved in cell wall biosynthesis